MANPKQSGTNSDAHDLTTHKDVAPENRKQLRKIPIDLVRKETEESSDAQNEKENDFSANEDRFYQKRARYLMRKLFSPREIGIGKK